MINRKEIIKEANYLINYNLTVRELASIFHRSKSAIHHDLTVRLSKMDYFKYKKVLNIFQKHNKIRHLKGGNSTKRKYQG